VVTLRIFHGNSTTLPRERSSPSTPTSPKVFSLAAPMRCSGPSPSAARKVDRGRKICLWILERHETGDPPAAWRGRLISEDLLAAGRFLLTA